MSISMKSVKIGTGILSAAMSLTCIGNLPVMASKPEPLDKNEFNTMLGTSGMSYPAIPDDSDSDWEGSYVYLGNHYGDSIRFRVLDPASLDCGTRSLFLDSDECLFKASFNDMASNAWNGSELQYYLNNAFRYDYFTDRERNAMAKCVKSGGTSYVPGSYEAFFYGKTVELTGEYVYLLDTKDVMNPLYGYSHDSGWELYGDAWDYDTWSSFNYENTYVFNHTKMYEGNVESWWLRSAFTQKSNNAGLVNTSGSLSYADAKNLKYGVAPALNVKLASILFSTAVTGTRGNLGTEYKLTLIDDDMEIYVYDYGTPECEGRKVTIPYILDGENDYCVNRVSVLITDREYDPSEQDAKILYYGELNGDFETGNAVNYGTFTLPSDLNVSGWGKDYYVSIIAEETNNDIYGSDFASRPFSVNKPELNNTTGWAQYDGDWIYYEADGTYATGWKKINGSWYLFASNGLMLTGLQKDGNNYYFLGDNGAMRTGWQIVGHTYYFAPEWSYFGTNGVMKTGWQFIGGKWYYFDENGIMCVGFRQIGGLTYFFNDDGSMKTGWMPIEGTYIYFGDSGAMLTGWQMINGYYYYFDPVESGLMAHSEYCGGYWLNANGTWTYPYKATWRLNDTGWWYGDSTGWYARDCSYRIDGKTYNFDSNGYCTNP